MAENPTDVLSQSGQSYVKPGRKPRLVIRDLLFVSPFAGASGDRPPRHNHPRKLHFRGARYRATPPQRGTLFRDGMKISPPSVVKGNLPHDGNAPSSPPLEGWRLAAGVVRDCGIIHLVPFVIASEAWRSSE